MLLDTGTLGGVDCDAEVEGPEEGWEQQVHRTIGRKWRSSLNCCIYTASDRPVNLRNRTLGQGYKHSQIGITSR